MHTNCPNISVAYMLRGIFAFKAVLSLFCVYKQETRLNEQVLYGSCDVILTRREENEGQKRDGH